MKDKIITNNLRNIKKSFLRFLSLLVMGALGMFAFSGLMATAPDMINSLDRYLDDKNVYDIKIISTLGLDPEDVSYVEALPFIEKTEGVLYRDSPVLTNTDEGLVSINSLPEIINLIEITSGRLPERNNEIIVEEEFLKQNNMELGDSVFIEDEDGYHETNVIITGTLVSPLFYNAVNINNNRGNTNIGSGTINYYAYMPRSNFKADYISTIYATVKGADKLTTGSEEYKTLVEKALNEVDKIKADREKARYDSVVKQAEDEIDNRSKEAKQKLEDAVKRLENARLGLDEAAKQLSDGETQISDMKKGLDDASKKLEAAKKELSEKEKELDDVKTLIKEAGREIGAKEAQLEEAGRLLNEGLVTLDEKNEEIEKGRKDLEAGRLLLDEKQKQADEAASLISSGEAELSNAQADLNNAIIKAEEGKKELDIKQKEADEAQEKLSEGKKELESGKASLDESKRVLDYIIKSYNDLISSENLTEDIINSEMERLKNDIEALRNIFDKLVIRYTEGTLSIEAAEEIIKQALAAYTREPTVLERIVFYRVAKDVLEPVIEEGEERINIGAANLEIAQRQLEEGKSALKDGWRQYSDGLKQISDGEEKLIAGKKELQDKKNELNDGLTQLKAGYLELSLANELLDDAQEQLKNGYAQYESNLKEYSEGRELLENAKQDYLRGIEELTEGEELIKSGIAQLEQGEREYNEGLALLSEGERELADGKKEYENLYSKYRNGLSEYEAGRASFDDEIEKARRGLSDIIYPTWYTYDRTGYQTYSDYFDDAESIKNLSRVFPIVFFMVAVMISLISMSRMVEMDRLEIGTLKSLGFSREKVITKYAFFSILATAIGGIIGSLAGLIIMPTLIFNIYKILFDVPRLYLSPQWKTTLPGFFIVMIIVVGAGMLKTVQVMKEKPADLLRPKAPKSGKRIFLERIRPLWRKLRFSDKITIRNLLRYKRRFFVTVFGIAGCTSLMLCGFGLKDAIVDIPKVQFDNVFHLDALVFLTGMDDNRQDSERISRLLDEDEIISYVPTMRIISDCMGYETNIFAVENSDDIDDIVEFTDHKSGERLKLESGKVIITDKLSRLTGLSEGDEIELTDINHIDHKYTISSIAKNYFDHYIFVDRTTLEENTDYAPNILYVKTKELTNEEQKNLAKRLLENPPVLNVTYKENLVNNAENMLQSLDKVVLILIILSALLSIVVLYNLSNININERHREIATLKVLGFYDKEVDDYINKENIIVTVIGIACGLLAGIFLTRMVVGTVEIEKAAFINHIKPVSYIIAGAMSAAFTLLVNFIIHFNLKKIDMIDSLKSVE